jgi:hypothetical protein
MALGGKAQELSKSVVGKMLTENSRERWLDFLQILQDNALSSLANTTDNDLVIFIRQVLD